LKVGRSPTSVGKIRLGELTLSPVSAAEIIEWIRAQMALGDLTNLAVLLA